MLAVLDTADDFNQPPSIKPMQPVAQLRLRWSVNLLDEIHDALEFANAIEERARDSRIGRFSASCQIQP